MRSSEAQLLFISIHSGILWVIFRIVEWMNQSEMLEQSYHLGDDNCQDFARLLWTQLSSDVPYPNPGKHGEKIMQMKELNSSNANGSAQGKSKSFLVMMHEYDVRFKHNHGLHFVHRSFDVTVLFEIENKRDFIE